MKLMELGIISDSSISTKADGDRLYKKLLSDIDDSYNNIDKQETVRVASVAMGCFFAKIYLNYNWDKIMTSKEFNSFELERFFKERFDRFVSNVIYELPYLGNEFSGTVYLAYSNYIKRLIKVFHHDRIINGLNDFLEDDCTQYGNVSLRESDVSFIGLYNAVVLGSKVYLAMGEGNE